MAALKALTQDSRFNIVIGGNPNAVDALVKQVDEAIAFAEASPAPAVEHGIPEGTCGVCYHLCDRCSHCDTQPAPASPDAGLVEPYDWARLGKLLQTGGMDDPAFLIGQVKGLLFHVASLSREHEALKAELTEAQSAFKEMHDAYCETGAKLEAAEAQVEALKAERES